MNFESWLKKWQLVSGALAALALPHLHRVLLSLHCPCPAGAGSVPTTWVPAGQLRWLLGSTAPALRASCSGSLAPIHPQGRDSCPAPATGLRLARHTWQWTPVGPVGVSFQRSVRGPGAPLCFAPQVCRLWWAGPVLRSRVSAFWSHHTVLLFNSFMEVCLTDSKWHVWKVNYGFPCEVPARTACHPPPGFSHAPLKSFPP